MNKKHFISLTLLFLFTISIFSSVAFAEDEEGLGYSIPYANIDLYIMEDGKLHIKEKLHYSFSGTYHGVYRDIPLKSGERIENIKISTYGAYSSYTVTNDGDNKHLKIYLYSDSQKKIPITDKDVDVFIEYDFINVIKIYNDIAELHYKLWGEDWDVDVGQVNSKIHLKSSKEIKYWLNPPNFVENVNWQNNTFLIETKEVPSGKYFEIRMAIPKDQFLVNPPFAEKININGLPEIEKIQRDYENSLAFKANIYSIIALIMLLSSIIPLIIYFIFGREPKIDYQAEYEHDLPTDDPPAVINAICDTKFGKEIGKPDLDGFRATIMDLINRQYLVLSNIPSNLNEEEDHSISVKIKYSRLEELRSFEIDVINFLKYFQKDGFISLERIKEELKGNGDFLNRGNLDHDVAVLRFIESYKKWKEDLKNEFLDDEYLKQLFNKKGDTYLKIFAGIGLIVSIVVFFAAAIDTLPAAKYAFISSIILGAVSMVSFLMPQRIAGHWTTYGEEYFVKWHNFAKYIQDFSLIKEYPPESIEIWDKYLVYATALGIANEARRYMELTLPDKKLVQSTVYPFFYFGGYSDLSSGLSAGMTAGTAGAGGAGGGAGGGGGGAF